MMEKRLCGVRDIARYLGIPTKTVYEWAYRGVLPSIKLGGRVLFDMGDIDSLLETKKSKNKGGNVSSEIL